MRVIDDVSLDRYRGRGVCEWCKKRVRNRHPHHIHSRGAGQLDMHINLVALCEVFSGGDNCHNAFHAGLILRDDLLAIVAAREGMLQSDIIQQINRVRRAPKECSLCQDCEGKGGLCSTCRGSGILNVYGEPYVELPRLRR